MYWILDREGQKKYGKEGFFVLDYWHKWMQAGNVDQVTLVRGEKAPGYFYCNHFNEVGENGHCGKSCAAYRPRNFVSGICKHSYRAYVPGDKRKTLKLKKAKNGKTKNDSKV